MTTMIDQMIEDAASKESAQRQRDEREYRELLRRVDARPKDAEALSRVCDRLGISLEQARVDAKAIRDAAAAEASIVGEDEMNAVLEQIVAKSKAIVKMRDETLPALEREADILHMRHNSMGMGNQDARTKIAELKQKHPLVFADDATAGRSAAGTGST